MPTNPVNALSTPEGSTGRPTHIASWRGQCVDIFARVEQAIAKTLALMRQDSRWPAGRKIPHFAGAQSESLTELIGEGAPFAADGAGLHKSLEAWRKLAADRAWIIHSTIILTCSPDDRSWWLCAELLGFNDGEPVLVNKAHPVERLKWIKQSLERSSDDLCKKLRLLQVSLSGSEKKLPQALYSASSRAP